MLSHLAFYATVLAGTAFAQTYTNCNPLNSTVCPADIALGTSATFNFTGYKSADIQIWNSTSGTVNYQNDGGEFTINEKGDSPTIQSNFYIFFGRVSTVMKAAPGTGIVSSIVLESDDLDEVDWEMIGGNSTYVETNFFGKGNTTAYDRAIWYPVSNNQDFHNYTTVWTAEKLDWYVDGNLIRTLNYNDSLALYGKNYPQTPMYVKIGIWAGGDSSENSNGTVEWAGGETNYKDGPFTMVVESIEVDDFSSGSSYTYSNTSGDYQSIVIASGNSTIAERLSKTHGVVAKFSSLSKTAKIAIAAGAISVFAIGIAVLTICCVRQRRAGRRERAVADAAWEKDMTELRQYKKMYVSEEEIHPRSGSGGKKGFI